MHLNPWVLECLGWLFIHKSSPLYRLAEKKATIGYTYEDSTVTEPDPESDKDEDNSENSESEEDEGIPDIGEEMGLAHRFTDQENENFRGKPPRNNSYADSETGCRAEMCT